MKWEGYRQFDQPCDFTRGINCSMIFQLFLYTRACDCWSSLFELSSTVLWFMGTNFPWIGEETQIIGFLKLWFGSFQYKKKKVNSHRWNQILWFCLLTKTSKIGTPHTIKLPQYNLILKRVAFYCYITFGRFRRCRGFRATTNCKNKNKTKNILWVILEAICCLGLQNSKTYFSKTPKIKWQTKLSNQKIMLPGFEIGLITIWHTFYFCKF